MDQHRLGERGEIEELVYGPSCYRETRGLLWGPSCRVLVEAEMRLIGPASNAVTTEDGQRHDHVISGDHFADFRADFAHHTGSLVPQDRGKMVGERAFEESQIGVTEPGGHHVDENLPSNRRGDIHLFDGERSANLAHHGCSHVPDTIGGYHQAMPTIDEYLEAARSRFTRVDPSEVDAALEEGALLVDIRPEPNRSDEGEIPGALVIDRLVLEWRLAPSSDHRLLDLEPGRQVIIFCNDGYQSSLAAAALLDLGVDGATDLVGGYRAWRDRQG